MGNEKHVKIRFDIKSNVKSRRNYLAKWESWWCNWMWRHLGKDRGEKLIEKEAERDGGRWMQYYYSNLLVCCFRFCEFCNARKLWDEGRWGGLMGGKRGGRRGIEVEVKRKCGGETACVWEVKIKIDRRTNGGR